MNPFYDPIAEYERYEMVQKMMYQSALRNDCCKMCKWYDDAPDYDDCPTELDKGYGLCRDEGVIVCGDDHPIDNGCERYEY